MSTSGQMEKVMTKTSTENGYSIIEKINITKHWNHLPKTAKVLLIGYTGIALGTFATTTYTNGQFELMKARSTPAYTNATSLDKTMISWKAAKLGCSRNVWAHFGESLVFPFKIISNCMPSLVLALNPESTAITPIKRE